MSSELRQDPLAGTWVLVCEERARRPQGSGTKICPFCPGNEKMTPPTILALPQNAEGPTWQVRVTANKFNVLATEPPLERVGVGVYLKESGVGAHEVIIEHPHEDHRHPADLEKEEWTQILAAMRLRMADLVGDKRFKYPVLFKNHGESAGASIAHPHWQLVVLPIVPRRVETALDACQAHHEKTKCCLVCRIINDELASGERVVWEGKRFAAWSYYASRFPYELILAPKPAYHRHRFEQHIASAELADELASAFIEVLGRLRRTTNGADFNVMLFTAPWFENDIRPSHGATIEHDFHWHFRITPRLTKLAGFEFGSGFYINQKTPEAAAEELREG